MRAAHPDYHNAPVAPFGDAGARLLIVGLAPGAHGANATGRPFTGDFAGILLYKSLHGAGLATRAQSVAAGDGLQLIGCRITNAVKCLPPENKPTTEEANRCNSFLAAELRTLERGTVILALGGIAHRAVLRACAVRSGSSIRIIAAVTTRKPGDSRKRCSSRYCSERGRSPSTANDNDREDQSRGNLRSANVAEAPDAPPGCVPHA
jgi:uracil-DNA glycosylase family 4